MGDIIIDNQSKIRPFGMRDKMGYLLGDVGNDFAFIFTTSYLMLFYTKVLGIEASIVGIRFLVSRILDAFTDIGMGTIVDKCKPTKDGKFRPWIKRMSGPFDMSTFLMYQSSLASAPMNIRIIYMFVTYILWDSIFYTAINIPYASMASVITENPNERASLSTFRNLGATVAAAFAVKLSSIFGKRELSMFSLIFAGLVFIVAYILKLGYVILLCDNLC